MSPECGTGTVRPGDVVAIEAGAGSDNASTEVDGSAMRVGPQYHC
ncbi:MAG: hypothetical protein ACYDH6_12180 [Acidimicrobiales bacterium]